MLLKALEVRGIIEKEVPKVVVQGCRALNGGSEGTEEVLEIKCSDIVHTCGTTTSRVALCSSVNLVVELVLNQLSIAIDHEGLIEAGASLLVRLDKFF
jgi:hypothetical protein